MNKISNIFKYSRKKLINYLSTNRLFLSYLIFSIISTVLIRNFTIGNTYDIKPLLIDMGIILIIGAFGYLVKPQNQFKYYFIWLIIFTLMCIINSVYYTFYLSFTSFSLIATLGQVSDVTDSLYEKIRVIDFIYLIFPILFFYIHHKLKNTNYYNLVSKVEKSKKMCVSTILAGVIFLACSMVSLTSTDYSRLAKQWNREYIVERFGIIVYQGNDLIQSLSPKINSLFGYDEAARKFREFFEKESENVHNDNKYTDIFEGKNVIFVHMESMQSVLMDMVFNGQEVTPNLNKLSEEGMYFSNFYSQISVGTSSDAEFTLSSSLMPSLSGNVAVNYYDRDYVTIQKLLKEKGYYVFSMHANKADMWNRSNFHTSFGYDYFYSQSDFTDYPLPKTNEEKENDPEWVGLGLSDHQFFIQAMSKMEDIERSYDNYMGTLITLSNHSPFDDIEKYDEFDLSYKTTRLNEETGLMEEVIDPYLEGVKIGNSTRGEKLGNYIKSAHYADRCLGEFIEYIKQSEYFDDTIFVFYGDHDAKISSSEYEFYFNYDPNTGVLKEEGDDGYVDFDYFAQELNRKVPLIIWSKDKKVLNKINVEVTDVMGMYDVLPTIGNMMGFENPYALGHDIFDIKENNVVIFPNGNFLTNKVYYNYSAGSYQTLYKNATITDGYIDYYKAYTEERLEISNSIIVYDLIKKENEKDRGSINENEVQN